MLMSESLRIADTLKGAMVDRYGVERLGDHFQSFDTICSATQDRQDAVADAAAGDPARPDDRHRRLQQQQHLQPGADLRRRCPTFHIAAPDCLVSGQQIRHRPVGAKDETTTDGWLPASGPVSIGLTSGASTPDNLVGAAVTILSSFCDD